MNLFPAAAGLALAIVAASAAARPAPDPVRGEGLFDEQCALCHQRAGSGQAPSLVGVVGRPAAGQPGVIYTRALSASGLTWTPETLNGFLADPSALVPGTAMPVALADPRDRMDVIAYLASPANRP